MTRHTARRLPQHKGPAAWSEILGPLPPAKPLKENRTADAVVVGGGVAGLSAARRLMQIEPEAQVVLLEAGRIGEGAAGRNSGFMIDLPHDLTSQDYSGSGNDAEVIALNRKAMAFAREAVAEYLIDPSYFEETGKVNGAASEEAEARNASYAKHLESLGESCKTLDAAAMEALTGSRYYRSGLYTPGTIMVQPAGYVRGMALGMSHHVSIHENSPVTALERKGSDWAVETAGGTVTTPCVVLATNGHIESFGFERGRLMHVFLFASMTEALEPGTAGGAETWGITPSDPMGTTMRRIDTRQGGDRIVTRTCAVMRSNMEVRDEDLAHAKAVHREKFDARFPDLGKVKMEYTWAGQLCLSRNSVSVARELRPGLFAAAVQNGLGLTRGTLTGIGAAELLAGIESDVTKALSAERRPSLLPPQPFRDMVGNAMLRKKEQSAAAE